MIDKLKNFFNKLDYKLVLLYGSQAKSTARENSDYDIAVLGENEIGQEKIVSLSHELSKLCQSEVDLIDLKQANFTLLEEVLSKHIVIKAVDDGLIPHLTSIMLRDKEDIGYTVNQILDEQRKRFLKK